ncbi:PaaX family transcriptional regulator [Nocardia brevicatena]|uniref:PaaX family transcriptional regulator n=1 Tax=Nocardia brevicatena TaxID=37327 RepID=UPI00030F1EC7|nr:PaaX family transcriptional regulator C-terminal domain-containing protein [Nocardia brevicatena]
MRPRALVFDLYGEYFRHTGGGAKLGTLTELMGLFGVEPATVRVAMTRLRRDGWFDSSKSGREVTYLLNDKSWRLLDDGRTRIFERHFGDWDRIWTQALVDEADAGRERHKRIVTALTWCGFGNYRESVWFSPHDRREQLREMLDGGDLHVQFLQCTTTGLTADRLIADRCWDLRELDSDYQTFIERFRPKLARYRRGLAGPEALVERMELVQDYRRYPFRDPDLPEVLLPAGWRGRAAHEVFTEAHELLRAPAEQLVASRTETGPVVEQQTAHM